jgi:tetratricopeptide (TPR) repeat protein
VGRLLGPRGVIASIVTLSATGVAEVRGATWKDCELSARDPDRSMYSKFLKRPSSRAHAASFHHRGLSFAAKGKLDQAISDISTAIQVDPQRAYLWRERRQRYRQARYQQVIVDITEAIPRDPTPRAFRFRSRVEAYQRLRDLRRAIADFDEAIRLDPVARSYRFRARANALKDAIQCDRALAEAEALGMSLPGCAAIPAPYRERAQIAYATGQRIVEMVHEGLKPSKILTRLAFENAIICASALGASTNCPPHINAIARHAGVELTNDDWDRIGYDIPLLVNMMPAGEYLGEEYYRAGGLPAVFGELLRAGKVRENALTVTGMTMSENNRGARSLDEKVIRPYDRPLKEKAGFAVLRGNLFDSAIMKTSVVSDRFRERYLRRAGDEDAFEGRAIVFDGPEDYHRRINDPSLRIDEDCLLVMRFVGPVGYPGSAEVINMLPPDALVRRGAAELPCIGDGRQSGTSGSPSILNASPEAAVGGGLALLRTGDRIRIDLKRRRADVLISDAELAERRRTIKLPELVNQTPWEEIYRQHVGQLATGAVFEMAVKYQHVVERYGTPRDNH